MDHERHGPARVMVFDLDDTLIVEAATARSSLRAAAALALGVDPDTDLDTDLDAAEHTVVATAREVWRSGPQYDLCARLGIASWEGLWATFEGSHACLDGLRNWIPGYRHEVWRLAAARLGCPEAMAGAMSRAYVQSQQGGYPLIDGAAEAVGSLSAGYRLGLLTNGPPDIQRRKLAATGLAGCFDAVVISGEVGAGKPDPAVFTEVLGRLGHVPDRRAVMVGDNWERDVVGALEVGMSAVWFASGRPVPHQRPGVGVVNSLGELTALMPPTTGGQ